MILINSRELNREKWAAIIESQQTSGESQKAWCLKNEVNIHNFVYWKKRLSNKSFQEVSSEASEAFEWANVVVEDSASNIEIEVGAVKIHLKSNFDEVLLKKLIRILRAI